MKLKTIDINAVLGYSVSGVMMVMGMAVLAGLVANEGAPVQLRYTFGTVLVLLSIYRFVLTRTNAARRNREDEEV